MTAGVDAPQAPVSDPAAAPKTNTLQRLVGALFAPTATFEGIARKPNVLVPLIIYIVWSIASSVLMVPHMDFETSSREQIEKTQPNLAPEDVDRMVKMNAGIVKGMFYASPVISIIFFVILAAILLGAFRILGGEGDFLQALSVTIYAWTPQLLKAIATLIIVMVRGKVDLIELNTIVRSNPGFLVDMNEHPVLFSLLSSLDLFTIWTVALLSIGFAYVSRFSKAKAATIVISLWAFWTVLKVGGAAVMSGMRKS